MQTNFKSRIQDRALLIAALTALAWGVGAAHAAVEIKAPESFLKLDTDGDGYVSAREAVSAMIATESFDAADRDHDGKLDTDEFVAAGLDKAETKTKTP